MSYSVCPSCGTTLADRVIPFNEAKIKLQNEIKEHNNKKYDEEIIIILKNLHINNYCCRTRLITPIDLVSVIK